MTDNPIEDISPAQNSQQQAYENQLLANEVAPDLAKSASVILSERPGSTDPYDLDVIRAAHQQVLGSRH